MGAGLAFLVAVAAPTVTSLGGVLLSAGLFGGFVWMCINS